MRDPSPSPSLSGPSYDVLVVGTGPDGCACAATLARLCPGLRVGVLEAGDRPSLPVREHSWAAYAEKLRRIQWVTHAPIAAQHQRLHSDGDGRC